MNRRSINYPGIMLGVLVLACLGAFARNNTADADRSLILLNGKPMTYTTFTIGSRGTLALHAVHPDEPETAPIPFRIYLKRGNALITSTGSNPNRVVTEVEIGNVLAVAKHGDELIIEPVRQNEGSARRTFQVVNYINMPISKWLFLPKKATDGC
ncbi:hypothetical protein BN8_00871 [Fibrisoma limi BUZ 3]|uniref:Pilus formation protein N-terminal domain-containing protein n=1 Tax=Fibrisoma limi BUZ 3 TaxID=1185876 RepID=I2GDD9_9BACT|nr:hypothetical protein [Fibrisoma limi]CCH51913.1 hypothetical protein BN8_00871 [Fibrisoma limi BUZ 3]